MSEPTCNIPSDVAELFANGENQYQIRDHDKPGDNVFAMGLFLECVDVPDWMIESDEGTQVILFDGTTRLCIDSYGLGDFHLHGYDVSVVADESPTPADAGEET